MKLLLVFILVLVQTEAFHRLPMPCGAGLREKNWPKYAKFSQIWSYFSRTLKRSAKGSNINVLKAFNISHSFYFSVFRKALEFQALQDVIDNFMGLRKKVEPAKKLGHIRMIRMK